MNLPPKYTLDGAPEGKRALYENRPVYQTVPSGVEAPIIKGGERRKVATFTPKNTRQQIERVAWLDYDVQNDTDPEQRQAALKLLADLFRGKPIEALEVAA